MSEQALPESCGVCPFFTQTFTQELKRKTAEGLRSVEVLTGICGVMRLSEIRPRVPQYETTHRRAGDARCYFEGKGGELEAKVSWLILRRKGLAPKR